MTCARAVNETEADRQPWTERSLSGFRRRFTDASGALGRTGSDVASPFNRRCGQCPIHPPRLGRGQPERARGVVMEDVLDLRAGEPAELGSVLHREAIDRVSSEHDVVITLPHVATASMSADDVIELADHLRGVTPKKPRTRKST